MCGPPPECSKCGGYPWECTCERRRVVKPKFDEDEWSYGDIAMKEEEGGA